jgi:ABC-type cobalamin transport system permease subunit
MNLELLGSIIVLALLAVGYFFVKLRSFKNKSDEFVWQPDLSHKVIVSEYEASRAMGGTQQTVILVEKTPEERELERKSYLKENRK